MASADAIQANFELDLAIVEDVLKQSCPNGHEALEFLVQIIGNRIPLPSKFADGPPTGLISCRLLSTRTQSGVKGFLSQYVINCKELMATSTQGVGDDLRWNSFRPSQQWMICVFLSLREADGEVPDGLHPLFSSWFINYALRYDNESDWHFHEEFAEEIFNLLCLWINMGYTSESLPTKLAEIENILSDVHRPILYAQERGELGHSNSTNRKLGALYSDAARNFGRDIFYYYWRQDTQVNHGRFGRELSRTVLTLYRIVVEYGGDGGLYKDIFTPFITEAFMRRSVAAIKDILISTFGLQGCGDELWHRPRRISDYRFVMEITESQGPDGELVCHHMLLHTP